MKRMLTAINTAVLAFVLAVALAISGYAASNDGYSYDLNIDDIGSCEDFLDENGIDVSDPSTIKNLTADSLLTHFLKVFRSSLKNPAKMFLAVLVLSLICEAVVSVSTKTGLNGEIFAIICFLTVSPMVMASFSDVISAMKSQQTFMTAYLPAFAAITAASGNASGAITYNAILLYTSEAVTMLTGSLLKPLTGIMLVMSCTGAINPELTNLTSSVKRFMTTIIGLIMTVFVGVVSLQAAVGRSGNEIALKAGKYLVSSFVPIIGMSLSESYKTVRLSLSAMRSALGAVGIVVIVVILSVPIISMCVYKIMFILLDWTCSMTGSKTLSALMRGLADVYSMVITILLIYALMFLISTGVMILIGGEAYI